MNDTIRFGVIGGSGLYGMEALTDIEEIRLETPFGAPSDAYIVGVLNGQRVAFLPRHGRGHVISPGRLNQRANIYGFKMLGVEYLIWDGKIWSLARDAEGWRPYDGGGMHDPDSITGSHADHVHVSVRAGS